MNLGLDESHVQLVVAVALHRNPSGQRVELIQVICR